MAQTYDDTLPSDRDKARSVLGITDVSTAELALVSDEYIDAVLVWKDGLDGAVAFIAASLASRYAQMPTSVSSSGKSVSWGERVRNWLALAASAGAGGITNVAALSQVPIDYGTPAITEEFARPLEYQP